MQSTAIRQQQNERRERRESCYMAALAYAREGIPVFPLNGKVPFAGSRGFYDATIEAEVISWWWRRWPFANVGVPTGVRSGWLALDIDPRHGGLVSLAQILERAGKQVRGHDQRALHLPPTRTAYTGGGGLHMIFALPADLETPIRNTTALAGFSGLDIRAEGGYIVVAPSKHESGNFYSWLNDEPVAPLPDLLLDLCRPRVYEQQPANKKGQIGNYPLWFPDDYLEIALRKARVGTRHQYALFLACRLVANVGLSIADAEPYMHEYARRVPHGDHDYPVSDALRCLEWASRNV